LVITYFLSGFSQVFAGPRDHANGFFLRLSAGGGVANSSIDAGSGVDLKLDGTAGDINFAIGGMIAQNLALHGTLWGWSVSDPDADLGGMTGTVDGSITLSALGGGITYYIMPANVYLSGSVGGGTLDAEGPGSSGSSDLGLVIDVTLGKEWWVGNSWGLGVAIGGSYHSIPDGGVPESWSGTSFALRFTATMN
jgi:hypothetical protein